MVLMNQGSETMEIENLNEKLKNGEANEADGPRRKQKGLHIRPFVLAAPFFKQIIDGTQLFVQLFFYMLACPPFIYHFAVHLSIALQWVYSFCSIGSHPPELTAHFNILRGERSFGFLKELSGC